MTLSRRTFLQLLGAAGSGLTLGLRWAPAHAAPGSAQLTPWLRIGSDDIVTVFVARAELGQRVRHASAVLVAEELEADWSKMRVEWAPVEPAWAELQTPTTSSASMRHSWKPLREAGATAREMLLAAAARQWGVPPRECLARAGAVVHTPTGRQLRYGQLAGAAALLPVPRAVRLKTPAELRYIGHALPNVDGPVILTGAAQYGVDVRPPGLSFAVIARPPRLGATVGELDAGESRRVPGVRQVLRVDGINGVAVVAADTWSAMRGRELLRIKWQAPATAALDSPALAQLLHRRAEAPADQVVRELGQAESVLAGSRRTLRAEYHTAYLTHAPLEPMNCTAHVTPDRCEVWAPTQVRAQLRDLAVQLTGLPRQAVTVHQTLAGGAFGRRGQLDHPADAIRLARAVEGPVQLFFTRDDDLMHGGYHPMTYQRLDAALDDAGAPLALVHDVVAATHGEATVWGGLKTNLPYAILHQRCTTSSIDGPLAKSPWRSVSRFHIAFARESFIDEIAAAARRDPLELRLSLLSSSPRACAVMRAAAERIGWRAANATCGLAVDEEFGTVVALAAELRRQGGELRLQRVVCAVDCGTVVDPRGVAAQVEGGVVFGLSAAMHEEITVAGGRVAQENLDDYRIGRFDETPEIEVVLIPSTSPALGVGEIAVPVVAPALANAVFAATGTRLRRLPFGRLPSAV